MPEDPLHYLISHQKREEAKHYVEQLNPEALKHFLAETLSKETLNELFFTRENAVGFLKSLAPQNAINPAKINTGMIRNLLNDSFGLIEASRIINELQSNRGSGFGGGRT